MDFSIFKCFLSFGAAFPNWRPRVDCVEEVPHRNWRKPEAQLRSSFLLHVQVDNKLGWKPSFYFTFQLALFAGSIFPLWFLPIQISLRNGSRLQVHLECPVQLTGRSSHCSLQFTIKTRCWFGSSDCRHLLLAFSLILIFHYCVNITVFRSMMSFINPLWLVQWWSFCETWIEIGRGVK